MKKKYYVAYGSNLEVDSMLDRCPYAKKVGTAYLDGYKLVFKGIMEDFSYLTLEKKEGSRVPLGVFEITALDEELLDVFEGYPKLYTKDNIKIKFKNKEVEALIYIMNENFDYYLPSKSYLITCLKGYRDFGFDKMVLYNSFDNAELKTWTSKLKFRILKRTFNKIK